MEIKPSIKKYLTEIGKKGGLSKSPKKVAASKRNAQISKEKRLLKKIKGESNAR